MENDRKLTTLVYESIDAVNRLLPSKQKVTKKPASILFDTKGPLDSLAFINLLVELEQRIEKSYGKHLQLIKGYSMLISQKGNPFRTVASLITFLENAIAP